MTLKPTLTEQAASFWSNARYEDLPPAIIRLSKRHLLDTLASSIAGAETPIAKSVIDAAKLEGEGTVQIWGRAERLPPSQAALVNGTLAHALELDDFGGCGHSGAAVIPAIFSALSMHHASGKDLLKAIVAGYDIASRALVASGDYAAHNKRGWHSTATCGTFGAAAGAACLLELSPDAFADALGIAGTYFGGLWAFMADGAETKRLHGGKASDTGFQAAKLAAAGISGPHLIMEAEWGGFLDVYARGMNNPPAFAAELGTDFHITRSGLKPYPCCRGVHSVLDILFDALKDKPVSAAEIERFVVHGDDHTIRQLGGREIRTLFDAQFSIPYCLAVGAVDHELTLAGIAPERLSLEAVRRLLDATTIVPDRNLGPKGMPDLEIHFRDGSVHHGEAPYPRGGPENPMTDAEVTAKAVMLIEPVLGHERAKTLIGAVWTLENLSDATVVAELTQPVETAARMETRKKGKLA